MSSASAGNCTVGGCYLDHLGHSQAFVLTEVNGTWRPSVEVPGTAALNQGVDAAVGKVSCGSPIECSAGGSHTAKNGFSHAFVVNQG